VFFEGADLRELNREAHASDPNPRAGAPVVLGIAGEVLAEVFFSYIDL
jgi:hypothetical protein